MNEYTQAVIIEGIAVLPNNEKAWYPTIAEAEEAGREYARICNKNGIRTILVARVRKE